MYLVQQQQQQPQKADRELHAKTPAAETGASEGLGKASPDILRLFSETQRNLLELNRSRLSALDELRIAKTKISDLGKGFNMCTSCHKRYCHIAATIAEGQLEQATTDSSHAAAASILQNSERKVPEVSPYRAGRQNALVLLRSCLAGTPTVIGLTTSCRSKHYYSCI